MPYLHLITFVFTLFINCNNYKKTETDLKTDSSVITKSVNSKENKIELTLNEKRNNMLDHIIEHLKKRETDQLREILSNYRPITKEESVKIIKDLYQEWGDFSKAVEYKEKKSFNKGDEIIISHLSFTTTHFGKWKTFKNNNTKSFLRIGLLFKKGSAKIGGFILDKFPYK